jgi:alpha-mannosidase
LSFLNIDNKKTLLSALKQSEGGNSIILRIYNLSSTSESCNLEFYKGLNIKKATIVNFLEEEPHIEIKASIKLINSNLINLKLQPHVISTIKIDVEK